jgi:peptidyl-prolyl cis-trans isomerase D
MLQSIRDKTHGWIAGIIISLLILSFALWGIHSYLGGGSVSDVVAKVNGSDINQGQLTVAYERLKRQMELQKANTDLQAPDTNLKSRALQSLVNLQVLKQASLEQNYRISQSQVENYLEEMPDFKVNGQFSASRFQQILNATLYSTNDFLELVKTTLLIDQPRLGVIFSSFSLPNEVNGSIDLINQERDIRYIMLPMQNFLNQPVTISQDTIQKYYNSHLEDFKKPEQVNVEYIVVSAKEIMNSLHPSDAELKKYYDENADSFNLPAKWKFVSLVIPVASNSTPEMLKQAEAKASEIYAKVEQGADLNTIARDYSLSKDSIISHDFITLNAVPAEVQSVLTAITAPQVIKPIKVNNGFLVIKITDYKKPEPQLFDQVKDQVKEALIVPKAEEQFANVKEKLANITYEHPESLKSAADELGLSIQVSKMFSRDKGDDDISNNSKIRDAAFSSDVLNSKNNSDVIPLSNDEVVVLRIKSHTPSAALPLSDVQNQISEKLKSIEINNRVTQHANEILQKLQTGANPDDVVKQYNLVWTNAGWLTRHTTKIDSAILDVAFDLPRPATINKSYALAKVPSGYALVGLISIKNGALARSDDYDAFSEQVQNTQGLLEYELYKQSLMEQAKIVIEQQ